MIKIILKVSIAILFLFNYSAFAQFQGEATYQTKRNFDFEINKDSTKSDKKRMINDDMRKQMREMLRKQFEKTYILTFNKTTSVYKEEEKLEKPQPASNGFSISFNTGKPSILYKNIKEKTFKKTEDSFGKSFLVSDSLVAVNWKMAKETKQIGKYLCMKATATKMVDDYDYKAGKKKEKQKELKIEAWYTPQIPVSNGPDAYYGLPGLILELHVDKMHYVCTKIVMNPKEKTEIKAPKKGKKINQKDFNALMEKKSKEMREQFKSKRKKGKGKHSSMSIFIEG